MTAKIAIVVNVEYAVEVPPSNRGSRNAIATSKTVLIARRSGFAADELDPIAVILSPIPPDE
jgi:hypothetical protein